MSLAIICCFEVFTLKRNQKLTTICNRCPLNFMFGLQFNKGNVLNICKPCCKSRKKNPQKLTQIISSSHPRHLVGNRTAQKDNIIDITSDSQVNNNFSRLILVEDVRNYLSHIILLKFSIFCQTPDPNILGKVG